MNYFYPLKKLLSSLCFICISFSALFAQVDQAELDAYLQEKVAAYDIAGLSIAILKDGEVDFEKAYRFANRKEKTELKTDAVFGIASLSKAFTATAIGMLVDEGKLKWTDKVSQYIDAFELSDSYITQNITVIDLLAHRSGYDTFDGDLLWYGTNYDRKEIIRRFAKYPMTYGFRANYGYQNIMFIIAGEIVEKVSGISWDKFLKQRIFEPLEMNSTFTKIDEIPSKQAIAYPHVKGNLDQLRSYHNSGGAAAISSNVIDLAKWLQMWLNQGIVNGDTLLQASTFKKITNLQTPIPPSDFERSNGIDFKGYGLGWFLMNYQGGKLAQHGGGLPGYISKIFFFPELKLGAVILTNDESSLPAALMYQIIDLYKQEPIREDWAELYLNFSKRYQNRLSQEGEERKENRNKKAATNLTKAQLVGYYSDKIYGEAKIELHNGELIFSMLPAKEIFTSTMKHWHYNTYQIKFKDKFLPEGYLTFSTNSAGEVVGLKIDLPNPDFHFHKLDFVKH